MKKLNKKSGELIIVAAWLVLYFGLIIGLSIKESINPSPPADDIQTMVQKALRNEMNIRKAQATNNVTKEEKI